MEIKTFQFVFVKTSVPVDHITWVLLTDINTYQVNAYIPKRSLKTHTHTHNSNESRFLKAKNERRMKMDIFFFYLFLKVLDMISVSFETSNRPPHGGGSLAPLSALVLRFVKPVA